MPMIQIDRTKMVWNQESLSESFMTVTKRMPLKARIVLLVSVAVVVFELISGVLELRRSHGTRTNILLPSSNLKKTREVRHRGETREVRHRGLKTGSDSHPDTSLKFKAAQQLVGKFDNEILSRHKRHDGIMTKFSKSSHYTDIIDSREAILNSRIKKVTKFFKRNEVFRTDKQQNDLRIIEKDRTHQLISEVE